MASLFRLVATNPPTRADFLSYFELGLVPGNASVRHLELARGVSVWETEDQARQLARRMRTRYEYIAEVRVPEGVRVVRQGRAEGHHSIYAAPDDLLASVVRVVAVRLESEAEGR